MQTLRIAIERQLNRFAAAVHEHDDPLAVEAALIDIHPLVGHEMFHLAFGDHVVAFAPFQQGLHEGPGLVLHGSAAGCLELIHLIAGPTARHIQTDIAVALLFRAVHQQLLSVIELRNAGNGQEEGHALFVGIQILRAFRHLAQEAIRVMILQETEHMVDVRIDIVVAQMLEHALQAAIRMEHIVRDAHQAEIHDRLQPAVFPEVQPAATLPVGGTDRIVHPGLTHNVIIRIFQFHCLTPVVHHIDVSIGIGVLADAIHTTVLNPPDGVLDQVFRHVRILLVQVRHGGDEPTVDHGVFVVVRDIGIKIGLLVVVGLHIVV